MSNAWNTIDLPNGYDALAFRTGQYVSASKFVTVPGANGIRSLDWFVLRDGPTGLEQLSAAPIWSQKIDSAENSTPALNAADEFIAKLNCGAGV